MSKPLYKVTFLNHGKVYELYARHVGGSSLWGFTILLFIFLRIDAGRNLVRT